MKITIPGDKSITVYPSWGRFLSIPGGEPVEISDLGTKWELRDEFTTAIAAGSVTGTSATPGPGVRTVVDTDGDKLSISSDKLNIAPKTILAWGNPQLTQAAQVRIAGKTLFASITFPATNKQFVFGWHTNAPADENMIAGFLFGSSANITTRNAAGGIALGDYAATSYKLALVLRSVGAFYYIKGGAYTNWTLLYVDIASSNTPLYPSYVNYDSTITSDFIRIPPDRWMQSPLLYATGAMTWPATDGYAGDGGLGAGGAGLSYVDAVGTWGIAGGKIVSTALDTGVAIAVADVGKADVWVSCVPNYSADTCGVVVRYVDALNYIYVALDGTNVKLFEVVAGIATERITGVKAPAAGKRLIVNVYGTTAVVYYNEAPIGDPYTSLNAIFTAATKVGLRTTNTANTFDSQFAYDKSPNAAFLDNFSRD